MEIDRKYKHSKEGKKKEKCDEKVKVKIVPDNKVFFIKQKDLPFVATESGIYKITENLSFGQPGIPAISFLRDIPFVLDGNNYTIDLLGTGTNAINIVGANQVLIKDIRIRNGSFSDPQVINIPGLSPNPTLDISNIGSSAINIREGSNINIKNVNIDTVLFGIVAVNVTSNIVIEKVKIFRFGLITTINNLTQPVGAGVILSGTLNGPLLRDVTVKDSEIQSETGYNAILLYLVNGATISNNSATAGRVLVAGQTIGCYSVNYSSAVIIKDCVARFSTQPYFVLRSSGVDIVNCQAYNTNQDGIEYVFSNNSTIKDCVIHWILDNTSVASPGSGIKIQVCDLMTVKNNVVTGFIIGTNPADANGAGIVIAASTRSVIQDNTVQGNNFGIKEILTIQLGPPPAFTGTPSLYVRNIAFGNLIQPYVGINPALISTNPATAGAWVNISS